MSKRQYSKDRINLEAKITVTLPRIVYDWLVEDQGGHEKVMKMVEDAGLATETALILTYELRQETKLNHNTESIMTDIMGIIDLAAQEATDRIINSMDDMDKANLPDP